MWLLPLVSSHVPQLFFLLINFMYSVDSIALFASIFFLFPPLLDYPFLWSPLCTPVDSTAFSSPPDLFNFSLCSLYDSYDHVCILQWLPLFDVFRPRQFFVISSLIVVQYVMLCYVMLCYVMLCSVMLCYVMLCYVNMLSCIHWTNSK